MYKKIESGFSLIESLFSMALIGTVLASLMIILPTSFQAGREESINKKDLVLVAQSVGNNFSRFYRDYYRDNRGLFMQNSPAMLNDSYPLFAAYRDMPAYYFMGLDYMPVDYRVRLDAFVPTPSGVELEGMKITAYHDRDNDATLNGEDEKFIIYTIWVIQPRRGVL